MRCFFAFFPPEHIRDSLSLAFSRSEKPRDIHRTQDDSWHITLAFLGSISKDSIKDIVKIAKRYNALPSSLSISALNNFPSESSKYLVATCIPKSELKWKRFVEQLREGVLPYAPNMDRTEWRPHITLAKAQKQTKLDPWSIELERTISWKPESFCLVESCQVDGKTIYRELQTFYFTS